MIKTLTVHGNSVALIIEKPILELLNISVDTPLRISTDGRSLIVSPADSHDRSTRFESALKRVNRDHSETMKKLAGIE
jgi:antitoxin component of MazEF toxin-antitoxin module